MDPQMEPPWKSSLKTPLLPFRHPRSLQASILLPSIRLQNPFRSGQTAQPATATTCSSCATATSGCAKRKQPRTMESVLSLALVSSSLDCLCGFRWELNIMISGPSTDMTLPTPVVSTTNSAAKPAGVVVMSQPITKAEVRDLFNLWNDALHTLDPATVAPTLR